MGDLVLPLIPSTPPLLPFLAFRFSSLVILLFALLKSGLPNPQITSWLTQASGKYARIFETIEDQNNANAVTTWSRGQGTQSLPTYAGINEVSYSGDWVYIRSTGLGTHIMGPWYLNAAKTDLFPNYPANRAVLYRIHEALPFHE